MKKLALAMLTLAACGDDGPTDSLDDGGTPDATVELDAQRPGGPDAALTCQLQDTYTFRLQGGEVEHVDSILVTASDGVTVTRSSDAGSATCNAPLAPCPGAAVDNADLTRLLYNPQVHELWGDGGTVHGRDERPTDGVVLIVERSDSQKIVIGTRCEGDASTACSAPVEALFRLREVYDEMRVYLGLRPGSGGVRSGACSAL
jgi:hypothetical protein